MAEPDQAAEVADKARKPFAAFIQEQRGGGLHGELSDALAEATLAATEHNKVAEVRLTVKIKPNGGNTLLVTDEVKTKVPEGERPAALFFTDDEGNLSRRDPRQLDIDDISARRQAAGAGERKAS
jgi:hypothetical protein